MDATFPRCDRCGLHPMDCPCEDREEWSGFDTDSRGDDPPARFLVDDDTDEEPPGLADTLDAERDRDFAEDLADARDDGERWRLAWNRGGE